MNRSLTYQKPRNAESFILILLMLALTVPPPFSFAADSIALQEDSTELDPQSTDEESDEDESIKDKLRDIRRELRKEISSLAKEYYAADSDEAKKAIVDKRREIELSLINKVIPLYHQNDDPKANLQSMREFARATKGLAQQKILEVAAKLHSDHLRIESFMRYVAGTPSPSVDQFFKDVVANTSKDTIKGYATLYQAELGNAFRELSEEQKEIMANSFKDTYAGFAKQYSGKDGEAHIEKLLTICEEEYATTQNSILESVARIKTQMQLAIGKVAPDIIGEDLDDVSFKLSDYRGKVVVLDFWGDW